MAQLVKPSEVQIITKDGELQINVKLDININLNQGDLSNLDISKVKIAPEQIETIQKTDWAIPDFGPSPKLKFGKKEV